MNLQEIRLRLPTEEIFYFVGKGGVDLIPELFSKRALDPSLVLVVSNPNVAALHGEALHHALEKTGGKHFFIEVPEGERYKNLRQAERLYGEFLTHGAIRSTPIVALGGGVITDLAAFAASTFMRGLPLVLIPTTLLAQADAAIGGKTGVNLARGKNLVGTFYHPRFVLIDPGYLDTLPERDFRNGLAEIVKMTLIHSVEQFEEIERVAWSEERLHPGNIQSFLLQAISGKAAIVEQDPAEKKERMLLNLGHTFAHGLEAATHYETYTHGEAVSIGLAAACKLAEKTLAFPPAETDRVERLLSRLGLPTRYTGVRPEEIFACMGTDKKKGKRLRFILPRKIGEVIIREETPEDFVMEVLEKLHGGDRP